MFEVPCGNKTQKLDLLGGGRGSVVVRVADAGGDLRARVVSTAAVDRRLANDRVGENSGRQGHEGNESEELHDGE